MEFSVHIQDWLAASLTVEGLFLFVLLLLATLLLGGSTESSSSSSLCDFLFLAAGALLGSHYFPDMPSVLPPGTQLIVALFSGMTFAGLVNIILFKPV